MAEEQGPKKQSFWHTLPGLLTGVAALLTAITGLIVVLNQTGWFSDEPPQPTVAPSTTSSGTIPTRTDGAVSTADALGTLTTSGGVIQFDRISGMAMGNGKLAILQLGTQVDIPLSTVRKITFGEKTEATIDYRDGRVERVEYDCYMNLPVRFHAGDREIYYGDCNDFQAVRQVEFQASE